MGSHEFDVDGYHQELVTIFSQGQYYQVTADEAEFAILGDYARDADDPLHPDNVGQTEVPLADDEIEVEIEEEKEAKRIVKENL